MDVKNCKDCGRLFNYVTGPKLCPACRELLEEKFQEVKKYIEENPKANISDISNELEVEMSQIQQWIREERLVFTADSVVTIECESCGKFIRTGRFCDQCKGEMTRSLNTAFRREPEKVEPKKDLRDKGRMRFL